MRLLASFGFPTFDSIFGAPCRAAETKCFILSSCRHIHASMYPGTSCKTYSPDCLSIVRACCRAKPSTGHTNARQEIKTVATVRLFVYDDARSRQKRDARTRLFVLFFSADIDAVNALLVLFAETRRHMANSSVQGKYLRPL